MRRVTVFVVALALSAGAVVAALLSHEDVAAEAGHGHEGAEESGPEHGRVAAEESGPDHDHDHGHGHGHGAPSDLDRPLVDLVSARCEHGVPTHSCAACRYEVGFVAVPPDVLAAGVVRTAAAAERVVTEALALPGEIRHDERRLAHVTPVVDGVVRAVHVDLMDAVTAGQPLLTLESAALGDAGGEWREARALRRLHQQNHRRAKALRERRILSEKEFLAARADLEQAEIRAQVARSKLLRLGLHEEDVAALAAGGPLGRLVVRAPIAGRVLDLRAVPGAVVGPGESVLLVGDLRQLWLWASVYERDLAAVLAAVEGGGASAEVSVDAFPGRTFRGTVDVVGGAVSAQTRTVPLRIVLPNPDELLRPGMFATARLVAGAPAPTLAVPAEAVLTDEGRDFVFVRHGSEADGAAQFVRRPVVRGREDRGWVAVRGELGAGQEVVTAGAFLLKSDVLREKMGAGCAD
jgi:cobalt-zinc-cadmium efflux system membrane fusion protein